MPQIHEHHATARLLGDQRILHPAGLTAGDWVVIAHGDYAGLTGILQAETVQDLRASTGVRLTVHVVGPGGTTVAEWTGDAADLRRAKAAEIPAARLIGVSRQRLRDLGYD